MNIIGRSLSQLVATIPIPVSKASNPTVPNTVSASRASAANPALFRLIFTSSAVARSSGETEALRFLRANVAAKLPDGTDGATIEIETLRAWALVHGLAMLMLDGQVPANDTLIERAIATLEP